MDRLLGHAGAARDGAGQGDAATTRIFSTAARVLVLLLALPLRRSGSAVLVAGIAAGAMCACAIRTGIFLAGFVAASVSARAGRNSMPDTRHKRRHLRNHRSCALRLRIALQICDSDAGFCPRDSPMRNTTLAILWPSRVTIQKRSRVRCSAQARAGAGRCEANKQAVEEWLQQQQQQRIKNKAKKDSKTIKVTNKSKDGSGSSSAKNQQDQQSKKTRASKESQQQDRANDSQKGNGWQAAGGSRHAFVRSGQAKIPRPTSRRNPAPTRTRKHSSAASAADNNAAAV